MPATLTAANFAALCARGARIHQDRASLEVRWVSLPGSHGIGAGAMPKERRFVMSGPSGVHSLAVDATDLERLAAHWAGFTSDPANRYA